MQCAQSLSNKTRQVNSITGLYCTVLYLHLLYRTGSMPTPIMTVTAAPIVSGVTDPILVSVADRLKKLDGNDGDAGSTDDDLDITIRSRFQQLLLKHYQDPQEGRLRNTSSSTTTNTTTAVQEIGKFWTDVVDICHRVIVTSQRQQQQQQLEGQDATIHVTTKTSVVNILDAQKLPFTLASDALEMIASQHDMEDFWTDYMEPALLLGTSMGSGGDTTSTTGTSSSDEGGGRRRQQQSTSSSSSLLLDTSTFFVKESKFQFLKFCNQLLHSIDTSASKNARWKGRVMLALSHGFSIGDASGRQTQQQQRQHLNVGNEDGMDVEETVTDALDSSFRGFVSSMELIPSIDVTSPSNSIEQHMFDLLRQSKPVFEAFESAGGGEGLSSVLEPELTYRSTSTVLHTQVNDPSFRSIVMAQFLIVASNLSYESPKIKSMLDKSIKRACRLLSRDNHALYDALWTPILCYREVTWRRWKKESKSNPSAFLPKVELGGRKKHPLTDDDKQMTLLSSSNMQIERNDDDGSGGRDDWTRIGSELRERTPTLEAHLQPYLDALDPENGIEEAYHPKNDSLYMWRANRLYAKHQLHRLSNCRGVGDLEKITRDFYKEKGIVIPGESEEQEKEEEENDDKEENEDEDEQDDDMKEGEGDEDLDSVEVDGQGDHAEALEATKGPAEKNGTANDNDNVMKGGTTDQDMKEEDTEGPAEGSVERTETQKGTSESVKEEIENDAPPVKMAEEDVPQTNDSNSRMTETEDVMQHPEITTKPESRPEQSQQGQKRDRERDDSTSNHVSAAKKSPAIGNNPGRGGDGHGRGGGAPGFGDRNDHRGRHHLHRGGPPDRDAFRGGGGGFDGRHHGRGGGRGRGGRGGRGRGRGGRR